MHPDKKDARSCRPKPVAVQVWLAGRMSPWHMAKRWPLARRGKGTGTAMGRAFETLSAAPQKSKQPNWKPERDEIRGTGVRVSYWVGNWVGGWVGGWKDGFTHHALVKFYIAFV